jgi:predicted DNA-binding transcriptional regulator AlpA
VKNNTKLNEQLLRLHEVLERLPCGKNTFQKAIELGMFPVRLGKRASQRPAGASSKGG